MGRFVSAPRKASDDHASIDEMPLMLLEVYFSCIATCVTMITHIILYVYDLKHCFKERYETIHCTCRPLTNTLTSCVLVFITYKLKEIKFPGGMTWEHYDVLAQGPKPFH